MSLTITLGKKYALVADAHDATSIDTLEHIFRALNRIGSADYDRSQLDSTYERELRAGLDVDMAPSMSVGDEIHMFSGPLGFWMNGWRCDISGWTELEHDQVRHSHSALLQDRLVHFLP